jgi:adenosylcobinamide-GDP ribazoletransferase
MLTVVPVPGQDADKLPDALYWFPVVGFLLGAIIWIVTCLFGLIVPNWPMGSAVAVISAGAVLTLFLHLDGLMDCTDGLLGGREREQILRIMKDPHVGAFGVIALILVLMMKWISVVRLIDYDASHWLIIAYVISRTLQVDLVAALPYARIEDGTAAPFVREARTRHRVVALVVAAGLVLIIGGLAGILALGVAWLVGRVLAMWFRHRIGGVTGDLLGTTSELIETGVLFAGAIMSEFINRWCLWELL